MTEHSHTTLVDGCFRCELNRDELEDDLAAEVARRVAADDGTRVPLADVLAEFDPTPPGATQEANE
jgi:hypothetical protein